MPRARTVLIVSGATLLLSVLVALFSPLRYHVPDLAARLDPCRAPSEPGLSRLIAEPAFGGLAFRKPVQVVADPATPGAHFVVENEGRVLRVEGGSTGVFLDMRERVQPGQQWGLQGLAFHPDFPTDPRAFVTFTAAPPEGAAGLTSRVSEFRSRDRGRTLDPSSERELLSEHQGSIWHPIGGLAFGPDGMLYVGWGEGGIDWQATREREEAALRGKILRIDVDTADEGPYGVPSDNPFVAGPFRPEVYAAGLRNPWRLTFGPDGELWVGDVGSRRFEEINRVEAGKHYGFPWREGFECLRPEGCDEPTEAPFAQHAAQSFCAVIGGVLYQGEELPWLRGKYVYADMCSRALFALDTITGESELIASFGDTISHVLGSVDVDQDGEIVLVSTREHPEDPVAIEESQQIFRVRRGPGADADDESGPPETLAELGCAPGGDPDRTPGKMLAYEIAAPAWDHGARAVRFVGKRFRTVEPVDGAVAGRPNIYLKTLFHGGRPVETQMLTVGTDGHWNAYSFAWNPEGSDARRVETPFTATLEDGTRWRFETAPGCFRCHSAAAGRLLGLTYRQLDGTVGPRSQLERWLADGTLPAHGTPADFLGALERTRRRVDPRDTGAPLDERARSYLDVNCSPCHRPGGSASSPGLILTEETPLEKMGVCGRAPFAAHAEFPDALLLDPGRPGNSLLYLRVAGQGALAMPPGRLGADEAGAALVADWINSLAGCPPTDEGAPETSPDH